MAKKSHADIMEKLSALKPSEPTRTRGKAARKPAAKKAGAKKAGPAKREAAAARPEPKAPAKAQEAPAPQASPTQTPPEISVRVISYPLFGPLGEAGRMYLEVCEHCFRLVTDANRTVANCNSLFVNSLSYCMYPGRWWRF
jgi:hypothetical protein